MSLKQTPSQTIGPFFAYGLTPEQYGYPFRSLLGPVMAGDDIKGERIRIVGQVFDGKGVPIDDALIEFWQADSTGSFPSPSERRSNSGSLKVGRCGTGTEPSCRYVIDTIRPGAIDSDQAPHINVVLTMRGALNHLFTRIYFADEEEANAADTALNAVPAERRSTLIAGRDASAADPVYLFDIHMQGDKETVFFDV